MDRESVQERFGIIGTSAGIRNVIDRVRQVTRTEITVLIEGESGVGKELIAEAIHALSPRRHEAMVVVNCGAIPEGLMESELFGAEKGAYTGAVEKRSGYFEEADGSTIFLDEIGEMPQAAQVRLLRVLESGEFSRVGSATARRTDVRIVAATNKSLAREVEAGRFREDLYYRLSTVLIRIPPLRERQEDIVPLFESFVHRFAQKYNSPRKKLTPEAEALLKRYRWPGNVRELKNVAEQAVVLLRGEAVGAEDLEPYLRGVTAGRAQSGLMRVAKNEEDAAGARGEHTESRERAMLYRALLELQHEVREMKGQVQTLAAKAGNVGVAVPRAFAEREGFSGERGDYVIVGPREGGGGEDYNTLIEDVAYEIEEHPPRAPEASRASEASRVSNGAEAPRPLGSAAAAASEEGRSEEESEGEEAPLPTLEDAEQRLISQALKRFDGNRRQTAQALGISERTLYRKLKDLDEDL